jgi:hypothetical protein
MEQQDGCDRRIHFHPIESRSFRIAALFSF